MLISRAIAHQNLIKFCIELKTLNLKSREGEALHRILGSKASRKDRQDIITKITLFISLLENGLILLISLLIATIRIVTFWKLNRFWEETSWLFALNVVAAEFII